MACVPNGIFAKINKYYDSITHDLPQLMHSNDLRLLVTIIHMRYFLTFNLIAAIYTGYPLYELFSTDLVTFIFHIT